MKEEEEVHEHGHESGSSGWKSWLEAGALQLPRVPAYAGIRAPDPPVSCLPASDDAAAADCTSLGADLAAWAEGVRKPGRVSAAALLVGPWAVAAARPPARLMAQAVALAASAWGKADGWLGGPVPGENPGHVNIGKGEE